MRRPDKRTRSVKRAQRRIQKEVEAARSGFLSTVSIEPHR